VEGHRLGNTVKRPLFLLFSLLLTTATSTAATPFVAALAREPALPDNLAGAVLLTELGCTACHVSTKHPDLLRPKAGPDLSRAGSRVAAAHLRRFLAEPDDLKPGTSMPNVLNHLPMAERDAVATTLAHYLSSLRDVPFSSPLPEPDAVDRGRALYPSVGCLACHAPESPFPSESVPLGPLADKYSVPSLTRFLEDPLAVRPGGRMPDLKLDHFEAVDIASFLLRDQVTSHPEFTPDPQLANLGREQFAQYRCGACHTTGTEQAWKPSLPLDQIRPDQGCLSRHPGPWPAYDLSEAQHQAIRAALEVQAQPFRPEDQVELPFNQLNCLACHQRGERGGVTPERDAFFTTRDENLGDQGRMPPTLTGVGGKLRRDALREVIVNGAAVRPYLFTRMPRFGAANSEALVDALRHLDPSFPVPHLEGDPPPRPHEIGRELAGSKGFNCVACHTFRGQSAAAIRAIDLMTLAGRLEEGWFHQYLAQPQRFSPLTIMPSFWPDGVSLLPEVLGGHPDRQRDALWQYLAQGPEAGQPSGLILEPLDIIVANEAVILRRAYPGIGKRGIGVGYPSGIHLAFDAELMRLASVWSGDFIEASALWRGQGAGQAHILGRDTVHFPKGPAFALLPSPDIAWPTNITERPEGFAFKGYSLDATRRPTFRYQLGMVSVEDGFLDLKDPDGRAFLKRNVHFPSGPPPPTFHFRVAADAKVEPRANHVYAVGNHLLVHLPSAGVVRDVPEGRELLWPVTGAFTLEYHLAPLP
jgi:mono/diheme cytochrome c family protein